MQHESGSSMRRSASPPTVRETGSHTSGSVRRTASVLRVPFTVKRYPGLLEREVGYGAFAAVSGALRRRGIESVRLRTDDARLAGDLREHRDVPSALTIAYVRLRCALNQFRAYEIAVPAAGESDLTARARSRNSDARRGVERAAVPAPRRRGIAGRNIDLQQRY